MRKLNKYPDLVYNHNRNLLINMLASSTKINNKNDVEEQQPVSTINYNEKTSWNDLMKIADNEELYYYKDYIKHPLFKIVLRKTAKKLAPGLEISESNVENILLLLCKEQNLFDKKLSDIIKFLKNIDSDYFLVCPECGNENELYWEICSQCNYNKNEK